LALSALFAFGSIVVVSADARGDKRGQSAWTGGYCGAPSVVDDPPGTTQRR